MKIKCIVMDMDGTLLKSDNTIDDNTKNVLIELEKKGVTLILASGRSYRKMMKYAKELAMDQFGGYLLEVNGMYLYDLKSDERTRFGELTVEDVHTIYDYLMPFHLETMCLVDDGIFDYIPDHIMEKKIEYKKEHQLPDDFPLTAGAFSFLHDNREGYPNIRYIHSKDEVNCSINKMCVAGNEDEVYDVFKKSEKHFEGKYWVGRTSPKWLEICPYGITKGDSLEKLLGKLNISKDEAMAFGDGENDIEMLTLVKYGMVMGNALPSVKEIAYDICDTNNNEGIYQMIRKYWEAF